MDSGVLAEMVERIALLGIDSVTVIRNGHVVLDAVVYPFPEDTGHIVHSCTKSVVGTLIGIAIDRGLLDGVHVPVVEVLAGSAPEVVDDRKAAMTVEDLLTMSSGLDCRDSYLYRWEGMREMRASDDWSAHVLSLPMREEPGTAFEYCNGASFLLSAIITEVTGTSAAEFAEEVLFGPIGIGEYSWPADPDGITLGWGELVLRPADMARFGYLYLRGGEWDGMQVVPEAWVETATTARWCRRPGSRPRPRPSSVPAPSRTDTGTSGGSTTPGT
jgi:CubicO group peptidase (beta-lactamase class C family)